MQRFRSLPEKEYTQGTYTVYSVFSPVTHGGGIFPKFAQTCADTVSNPGYSEPHDFELNSKSLTHYHLTGEWWKSPSLLFRINSFYNPGGGLMSSIDSIPDTSVEDWDYWFTKALANMNPNKPEVDVPLFLAELKDFPRMLHNLGRWLKLSSGKSKAYKAKIFDEFRHSVQSEDRLNIIPDTFLSYSFGWAPLISDLLKLSDVHEKWEQRIRELKKMKGGNRIKRTLHSEDLTDYETSSYFIWLFSTAHTNLEYTKSRESKVWFTAYPTLLSDVPQQSDTSSMIKNLYGIGNASASTLWNILPWSWMIDYFYNVGDVLQASGGLLDWEYDKVCVMSYQKETYTYKNWGLPPGIEIGNKPMAVATSKRRRVRNHPTPTFARTPWLSQGQKSNLGALSLVYLLR